MKCPLLQLGWIANPQLLKTEITDCFKEECAWWDGKRDVCSILQLSQSIFFIENTIAQMETKMPHELQFRK